MRRVRGMTLLELVIVLVVLGIIVGMTAYFAYPIQQGVALAARADLTNEADNALQRIGREVHQALPNSVRRDASGLFLEFLPVRTAGRYRADIGGLAGGANCPGTGTDGDQLSFGVADTCFKTIGTLSEFLTVTGSDFLVLNNYGPGFTNQDAYAAAAANRALMGAVADETTRMRVTFTSTTFTAALHDSIGKRFFIVPGNGVTGLPEPVTYECDLANARLLRRWGYTMTPAQPTSFSDGSSVLIAENVAGCSFDYVQNVAPQIGLLTLQLTLSKTVPGGNETVSLYHAVHVSNVP